MAMIKAFKVKVIERQGKRVIWYIRKDVVTGAKIKVKETAYAPPMHVGKTVNVCGKFEITKYGERRLFPAPKTICDEFINSIVQSFEDYKSQILKDPWILNKFPQMERDFRNIAIFLNREEEATQVLAQVNKRRFEQ